MKIRKINQNYLDQIMYISNEQFGLESWTKEQFNDALQSKNYDCYGIINNDRLISYCLVLDSIDDLNILSIATLNQHKNNGYATMLINYVIRQGQNESKTVSLEVKEKNQAALSLYTKLNFKIVSKRKNYYKDGDTILSQTTKDGTITKDMVLYGKYYYGVDEDLDVASFTKDDAMFVAELYTDSNGEQGFGHFYNGGDL